MSKLNKVLCFFGFHDWELQESEYRGVYIAWHKCCQCDYDDGQINGNIVMRFHGNLQVFSKKKVDNYVNLRDNLKELLRILRA